MKIGEGKAILQAMRSHERSYPVNVAETKNQDDYGLRGDGVQTCSGRIVEHDRRPVINARAIETRRRIPPESSEGNISIVCSSSTNLRTS